MGRKTSYKQTTIRIFFDLTIDDAADVFIISRIRPQSKAVIASFFYVCYKGYKFDGIRRSGNISLLSLYNHVWEYRICYLCKNMTIYPNLIKFAKIENGQWDCPLISALI